MTKLKKKRIIIIAGVVLVCLAICICLFIGTFKGNTPAPESWKGIYNGTVTLENYSKDVIWVTIEESDVRTINISLKESQGDIAYNKADNSIELPMTETGEISFFMKAFVIPEGSDIAEEDIKNVYIRLKYIDEKTISIKYGESMGEMENCEPVKLYNMAG